MDTAKHQDVAARAYAIWEEEGRPDGRNIEHWYRAERELAMPMREAGDAGSGARARQSAPDTSTRSEASRKPTLAARRGRRVSREAS